MNERIEYHPIYFRTEPTKQRHGSAVLVFDRVRTGRRRDIRKLDAVELVADASAELDRLVMEWVESNAATEAAKKGG